MNNIYVVGGQAKKNAFFKQEWFQYKKGIIIKIGLDSNIVEKCVDYISPPDVCLKEKSAILFKASTLINDKLYVPTQTEIIVYKIPTFELVNYISLPLFNDIHHVRLTPQENLLVVNTGLDMVIEVTSKGEIVQEWNVLGRDPWYRFKPNIDYRQIPTTKPHQSHPNYVFYINNEAWVTRFEQRDAICLNDPKKVIVIGIEKPHDGIIYDKSIFFTTVDGNIVIVDQDSLEIKQIVSLNKINNTNQALGWCRSLEIVDQDHILVGFSRLRPTKNHQNIRWLKYKLKLRDTVNTMPTRIALYNIKDLELCWEYSLEEIGMNAVFSIHKV